MKLIGKHLLNELKHPFPAVLLRENMTLSETAWLHEIPGIETQTKQITEDQQGKGIMMKLQVYST